MNWERHAACRNHDPEIFFQFVRTPETREAVRICGTCPVRRRCLDDALQVEARVLDGRLSEASAANWIHGVRGGLIPEQRRQIIVNQADRQKPA
jgi:hypothetical protein